MKACSAWMKEGVVHQGCTCNVECTNYTTSPRDFGHGDECVGRTCRVLSSTRQEGCGDYESLILSLGETVALQRC